MLKIAGYWWPDNVGKSWEHALRHVKSLDYAISICKQRRVAIQAGGNIGLWPRKLGQHFANVYTFEPDADSRACLIANVADYPNVRVEPHALGDGHGVAHLRRGGLGSHKIAEAAEGRAEISLVPIDRYEFADVDLIQLDVEGYEWHALTGAWETVKKWHPVIQLEYRNFTEKYGKSDAMIDEMLKAEGYKLVSRQPGSDVVYA